ncbi:thiamine biosynthesis protein ThiS [Alistipes ihumii]
MEVFLNGTKIPTEAATLSQLIEQQRIPVAGIAVALGGCEMTVIRATQGG